ncbi:hypothetical protein SDC9_122910 [bioreactor metagenome]|uniref:HTH araC/xylS-type domain-containing protein n=1 Tax=bioreactor metagenome TaxID=1076179 RepID=A0A645CG80_9ZZZZ
MQLLARNDGARISAAEAAASCNLSISRFSHLWRDHFGNGFGAFELQYRFTQAVNELLRDDGTVKEVSAHWGFCDENHFARLFKSIYRSAPGGYRRQLPRPVQ